MPDNTLETIKAADKMTQDTLQNVSTRLQNVKFTPVEGQIAFVKELIKQPAEAKAFMNDPKTYAVEHGILLNPDVIRSVVNQVMFDTVLDEELVSTVGQHAAKDIADMRAHLKPGKLKVDVVGGGRYNPVANAAAVAAGAAVVMAVVAVVTMVVTLVRATRPGDLVSLQGLGAKGVLLPGNQVFVNRTKQLGGIAAIRGMGIGIR